MDKTKDKKEKNNEYNIFRLLNKYKYFSNLK